MTNGTGKDLLRFHNFDHFAALVLPAMRASPMSANLFVAVRAIRQLRNAQRIMSAAGRGAPLGVASFWIRHW